MTGSTAGYSGKPLAEKLGIRAGCRLLLIHAPDEYESWVDPLPPGVCRVTQAGLDVDLVHVFVTDRDELARCLREWRRTLRPDAVLWVSWPKKAAGVPTNITEDVIREVALPLDWVDVKVCAVSPVWSGLKLVVRKAAR